MYKNVISVDIRVNGEKLDTVGSFKYLGAVATVKSGFQAWSTAQNLTDDNSTTKTEDHLER